MFDTNIVIVGNVLTAPEWRRTSQTNALVANFKVASTARRLDRESGRWVDGNSLRVRVNCWRKLAEGVASSIMVGDPVVVVGRLYTRDWTDAEGNPRTMYEMEAVAVGHDLARGRGSFRRNRPTLATSVVESPETDAQVRGEAAEPVPPADVPARYGEGVLDGEDSRFAEVPPSAPAGYDPVAVVRGGGFEPFDPVEAPSSGADDEFDVFGDDGLDERPAGESTSGSIDDDLRHPGDGAPIDGGALFTDEAPATAVPGGGRGRSARSRGIKQVAEAAGDEADDRVSFDGHGGSGGGHQPPGAGAPVTSGDQPVTSGDQVAGRRPRRTGRRIPVPA